ncbi:MAG: hypothetical protein GX163_02195 [Bacteroidetes bacterium]|nr:hypothetical protein [Bacteroidota bacterium]
MNKDTFTYLLAHPEKTSSSEVVSLEMLLRTYPFFQSARALQLKGLKDQGSYRYNDALKVAATHTTDRDVLFQFITSEHFIQHEISKNILQHSDDVHSISVVIDDISEAVKTDENARFEEEKQKAAAILNPNLFERKTASIETMVATHRDSTEVSDTTDILQPKPLEFTKKDRHSFSEWLKLSKLQHIDRKEEKKPLDAEENDPSRNRQAALIEKFIQEKPRIVPGAPKETVDSVADTLKKSSDEYGNKEALMTETLANVYLQQRNFKKAIQAYKILILKYPEKSSFFADQIRAIEKQINPEDT